jgi:hypothetical protein
MLMLRPWRSLPCQNELEVEAVAVQIDQAYWMVMSLPSVPFYLHKKKFDAVAWALLTMIGM